MFQMQMCGEVAAGFFCCLHVSKAKNYTKRKNAMFPRLKETNTWIFFGTKMKALKTNEL